VSRGNICEARTLKGIYDLRGLGRVAAGRRCPKDSTS